MESTDNKPNKSKLYIIAIVGLIAGFGTSAYLNSQKNDNSDKSVVAKSEQQEDVDKDVNVETEESTDNGEYDTTPLLNNIDAITNADFDDYEILSKGAEKYTFSFNALDTIIDFVIYSDNPDLDVKQIIKDTEEVTRAYEYLISKTIPTSFTYTINQNKTFDYSAYEFEPIVGPLIDKSMYYSELTGGKFDITVEPLVALWDINKTNNSSNPNAKKPEQEQIDEVLKRVDYTNFVNDVDAKIYTLENDATIDFGAIAKGYAADIIKGYLMSRGVDSALINFGGNVNTIGVKPDGKPWVVAVQNPRDKTNEYIATIELKNMSAVTSGNYEKYFIQDGVRYHHIVDPDTGYPGNAGLIQTTVISKRSIDCDALSTSTFLLGADEGTKLINSLDGVESVFVTENDEFVFSENFEEEYNFKPVGSK